MKASDVLKRLESINDGEEIEIPICITLDSEFKERYAPIFTKKIVKESYVDFTIAWLEKYKSTDSPETDDQEDVCNGYHGLPLTLMDELDFSHQVIFSTFISEYHQGQFRKTCTQLIEAKLNLALMEYFYTRLEFLLAGMQLDSIVLDWNVPFRATPKQTVEQVTTLFSCLQAAMIKTVIVDFARLGEMYRRQYANYVYTARDVVNNNNSTSKLGVMLGLTRVQRNIDVTGRFPSGYTEIKSMPMLRKSNRTERPLSPLRQCSLLADTDDAEVIERPNSAPAGAQDLTVSEELPCARVHSV